MSTTLSAVGREAKRRKITWIKVFFHAPILCSARQLTGVAIDFAQEKVFGQGPQDNESALEQAKDEQISDCRPAPSLPPRETGRDADRVGKSFGDSIRELQGRNFLSLTNSLFRLCLGEYGEDYGADGSGIRGMQTQSIDENIYLANLGRIVVRCDGACSSIS